VGSNETGHTGEIFAAVCTLPLKFTFISVDRIQLITVYVTTN